MAEAVPPDLSQLQANLCLTREDIIDDSQKTDVHVANRHIANTLFQNALSQLVTTTGCTGLNLLDYFNRFINGNIDDYRLLGRDLYKISIPYDVKCTVKVSKKNKTKAKEKEMLVRIMEDLTQLEKQCAPFFFVKDNHGFKNLDEKFCLASFYDEGSRRITTGGLNVREYLSSIYPVDATRGRTTDTTYTIDLTANGMTTIANSTLTAHWDARGGGDIELNENEILFTLTINNEFVKCVFTYTQTLEVGRVTYTHPVKRPISCSISTRQPFTNAFIEACFGGNSMKNGWFNSYQKEFFTSKPALMRETLKKCGMFIQLGKAIGDASFVFSKDIVIPGNQDKRYSVGTSDIALALRCCINTTDVVMYLPRGVGALHRYYMSIQYKDENLRGIEVITNETVLEILAGKKTSSKKKNSNYGRKKESM